MRDAITGHEALSHPTLPVRDPVPVDSVMMLSITLRKRWFCQNALQMSVLVCQGCCNKVPQTGWLKQQKFIVSQSRRLQV